MGLGKQISNEAFTSSLQVLDDFSKMSGLKLNDKKTEVLWIGANEGSGVILCPEKDFKWVKKKVKALGVWFSTNPEDVTGVNFYEKQVKITNCLSCWENRRLSLMGKITVLNSLIASQLVYILSPLPTEHYILNEILLNLIVGLNKIIFKSLNEIEPRFLAAILATGKQ